MKKNNFKKAMFSAVIMLIAAVICLTGVTYAWFTKSYSAHVGKIDVNIEAAKGLQISLDGDEFGSSFTWEQVIEANEALKSFTELSPVSTTNALTDGEFSFFSATLDEETPGMPIHAIEAAAVGEGYIAFPVYIYNPAGVTEGLEAGAADPNAITVFFKDFDHAENITSVTGAGAKASRFAIVTEGSAEYGTKPGNTADATSWIYEPDQNSHTAAGKVDYKNYGIPAFGGSVDGAYKYLGIAKSDGGSHARYTADDVLAEVTTTTTLTDKSITVNPGQVVKTMVYIWAEGQDADCENSIGSKPLSVDLWFGYDHN